MTNLENTIATGCTIDSNEFQQIEQPTNGTWLNSICLKQNMVTHLKLVTTTKHGRINLQVFVNMVFKGYDAQKYFFYMKKMFLKPICVFELTKSYVYYFWIYHMGRKQM